MGISRVVIPLGQELAYVSAGLPNTGITTIELAISYGAKLTDTFRVIRRLWSVQEEFVFQITQGPPIERPYSNLMEEGKFISGVGWADVAFGAPAWVGTLSTIARMDDYDWDYSKMYCAVWSTPGLKGLQLEVAITYSEV